MTGTNEAAERLRAWSLALATDSESVYGAYDKAVDAALAAERRATVERIRAALQMTWDRDQRWDRIVAILDAEAER